MKSLIWLSYDLGVKGDYEGLYLWLDSKDAHECGQSVAALTYEYKRDLLKELLEELKENIETDQRTRFYVIREEEGKPKGKFILGRRRAAPWVGYAPSTEPEEDYEQFGLPETPQHRPD